MFHQRFFPNKDSCSGRIYTTHLCGDAAIRGFSELSLHSRLILCIVETRTSWNFHHIMFPQNLCCHYVDDWSVHEDKKMSILLKERLAMTDEGDDHSLASSGIQAWNSKSCQCRKSDCLLSIGVDEVDKDVTMQQCADRCSEYQHSFILRLSAEWVWIHYTSVSTFTVCNTNSRFAPVTIN